MRFFLHWGCLLIIALVAPIALPAGGGDKRKVEVEYLKAKDLSFAGDSCFLLSSPFLSSPSVCEIKLGTPIRIIRLWENEHGERWLQVEKSTMNFIDQKTNSANRGWLNV